MFIDAASGRVFPLRSKLFCGVEAVYNDENYFVNLQSVENGL